MTYSSRYAAAHYRHRDLLAAAAHDRLVAESRREAGDGEGPLDQRHQTDRAKTGGPINRSRRAWGGPTVLIAAIALLGLVGAGALAKGGPPPVDATPGSVGFQGMVLAGLEPAVAPGYRLVMAESVFAPGAYVTSHTHPTAIVVCVQSGALGFAIQHGAATVTRGVGMGTPTAPEPLALNTKIVLQPRDCVAFDHFTQHTAHTGWNASDGPTVLWEARLLKTDEPFTTFVDAQGTSVP